MECTAQKADAMVTLPSLTSSDDDDSRDGLHRTDDRGHVVVKYLITSDVQRLQFKVSCGGAGGLDSCDSHSSRHVASYLVIFF